MAASEEQAAARDLDDPAGVILGSFADDVDASIIWDGVDEGAEDRGRFGIFVEFYDFFWMDLNLELM